MEKQMLIDRIERLKDIVSGWEEGRPAADIERELVLEKLRGLYEEVLLSGRGREGAARSVPEPPVAAPAVGEETSAAASALVAEEPVGEPAGTCSENEPAAGLPDSGPVADEPVAPDVSGEAGPVGEPSLDQKLFSDEQVVRPRMDKQVILSLYGDAPVRQASSVAPSRPAPEPFGQTADSARETTVADGNGHKKVLGEMIGGNGGAAMNEVLGRQAPHADVASVLHSQSVKGDLRHSIGVNDRFMLIRNLFDGDGDAYAEMIARLNEFTDLDEAMLYIQENCAWNPENEAVQLLVDLLERKLG